VRADSRLIHPNLFLEPPECPKSNSGSVKSLVEILCGGEYVTLCDLIVVTKATALPVVAEDVVEVDSMFASAAEGSATAANGTSSPPLA
jgi:hypothetical protein